MKRSFVVFIVMSMTPMVVESQQTTEPKDDYCNAHRVTADSITELRDRLQYVEAALSALNNGINLSQ